MLEGAATRRSCEKSTRAKAPLKVVATVSRAYTTSQAGVPLLKSTEDLIGVGFRADRRDVRVGM